MQTARDRNPRPHRSWGAAGDGPGAAGVVAQPAPSRSVPRHHHQGRQAAGTAGAFGLAGTGWAQLVLKNQAPPSAAHLLFTACSSPLPPCLAHLLPVCFLPTPAPLSSLSEERGDGSTFLPS